MSNVRSSFHPKRYRQTHGFSLTELLITIAIIGILAAIGLNTYREQMIQARLAEGAQVIARELDRARQAARLENRVTVVAIAEGTEFDSDSRAVQLPGGVSITSGTTQPHLLFVPPYGAAFLSTDTTYDSAVDSRFEAEVVRVAWSANSGRTQDVSVVGVLGKPVIR